MDKLLTIIIPIYNVEAYVGECIHSVCRAAEGHDDIEVVVVDDGSPDHSADIVRDLQCRYPSLRLVSQENRGLGGARNRGVEEAHGRFMWFVDSDDTLTGDWTGQLLPLLRDSCLDAVAICAADADDNGTPLRRFDFKGLDRHYSGIGLLATGRFSYCAPFTIYRRDFLTSNGLRFAEHLYHEDMEFTPRAYILAGRIALLDEAFYVVRSNPQSITRSVNFKKNFDLLKVAKSLDSFRRRQAPREARHLLSHTISLTLNSALATSADMPAETRRQFAAELAECRYLFANYAKSKNLKYICQGILFTLLPVNPEWVYNHIQKKLN